MVVVVVVVLLRELLQEEFQRYQVVVVGVSTEEVVQLEGEFEEVDQLSSLPVKVYLFQVMAFQALALVLLLLVVLEDDEAIGVVELDQQLEMKQCFPHNLRMRSHCWSQFLFWGHLQCWKFLTEELVVAVVVVVGVRASQGGVFDISLLLHLFLSWLSPADL